MTEQKAVKEGAYKYRHTTKSRSYKRAANVSNYALWYRRWRALLVQIFGNKCQQCGSTDLKECEFAHIKETPLSHTVEGRGSYTRLKDIVDHPDCYLLLCASCHKILDGRDGNLWCQKSRWSKWALAIHARGWGNCCIAGIVESITANSVLASLSNISEDLSLDECKAIRKMIALRFGVPWFSISIGNLASSFCMFHQIQYRDYGINGSWRNDFCYPCFSRAAAQGDKSPGFGQFGKALRAHKSHWARG